MQKRKNQKVLSGVMAATMVGSSFSGIPTVMAAQADGDITPVKDTYVNNLDSDAKGNLEYALLGSTTGNIPAGINDYKDTTETINMAYLSFDISGINEEILDNASLVLSVVENAADAEGAKVSVFESADDISETDTTWDSKPEIVDKFQEQGQLNNITESDEVSSGTVENSKIVVGNLGNLIKAARKDGKNTITLAVYLAKDVTVKIATKEDSANAPKLELTKIDDNAITNAINLIMALPEVSMDNYKDYQNGSLKQQRQFAKDTYDALTESEQAALNAIPDVYAKLLTFYADDKWETTLNNYENAEDLIVRMKAIRTSEMNKDNYITYKQEIQAIRNKFDNVLPPAQRLVGNKNYQLLVNAETKYNSFEASDIDAVKEKILLINPPVEQDNYLDKGENIVNAREAYDTFASRMFFAYRNDPDGYIKVMSQLEENTDGSNGESINYKDILDNAEAAVEVYKPVTAAAFVDAWNAIKDTVLPSAADFNEFTTKEDALNEFEGEYYSSPINNLSKSVYYESFADGTVSAEVAEAIEGFLCAKYQLAVDAIRLEFGDPGTDVNNPSEEFKAQFNDPVTAENMFIYLHIERNEAEVAYEKLSEASKEAYEAESNYCDRVFNAMMCILDEALTDTLNVTLPEAELTKEYIDKIKEAKDAVDDVSPYMIGYLEKYSPAQLGQYNASKAEINEKLADLQVLAEAEFDKYAELSDKIDNYGLNYMSGYYVDYGVGIRDDNSEYWSIEDFVGEINSEYSSIDPKVNGVNSTILEYYYSALATNPTEAQAELEEERDNVSFKILNFVQHNDEIVQLREKAAECNEDIYRLSLILDETELNSFPNVSQDADYALLEEILNDKGIEMEAFIELFSKLNGEIETDTTSYRALTANYALTYPSENFTDIKEPYMSDADLGYWDVARAKIAKIIDGSCPDVCTNWMAAVDALEADVANLDKEYEYSVSFAGVNDCRQRLSALKAQLEGFSVDEKYYILSEYIQKIAALDVILNTDWTKAIEVMDKIDAAYDAELEADWYAKLIAAENALDNIQNESPSAYDHIAEAAKEKLINTRNDYDVYAAFNTWINNVENIDPKMIDEYAQLYKYSDDGTIVENDFSLLIESLKNEIDNLESLRASVNLSQKMIDYIDNPATGYDKACLAINKLAKEKDLAFAAEALDKRIIALDSLIGQNFVSELERLRTDIDALIATISYEGEEKRGNDAAIEFNMITQYAKYEQYVNNYDKSIADNFKNAVDAIGEINYTTNLDIAKTAIQEARALEAALNDSQEKFAFDSILKLEILSKKYDKVMIAQEAAQDYIADIEDMVYVLENAALKVDPYDYKCQKLFEDYGNIIAQCDVVDALLDELKNNDTKNAYKYLADNQYIEIYENTYAEFLDNNDYIGVMLAIDVLYTDSKEVITIDADGNVTIDENKRNILVETAEEVQASYKLLDEEKKNNVLNYSSLQWVVKNIDADKVNAIIENIERLPAAEDITYAKYIGVVEQIKKDYDALLSENQARVQTHTELYKKFIDILTNMGIMSEDFADLGGRLGDVNADDVIDINDAILMVDYALGIKTPENDKQFLRANIKKNSFDDASIEEKIDFFDVAAVIDLIEFDN